MIWYRAAELKHGRVAMLASLGQIVQHFTHWNDPSGIFDKSDSPWQAMQQVGGQGRQKPFDSDREAGGGTGLRKIIKG